MLAGSLPLLSASGGAARPKRLLHRRATGRLWSGGRSYNDLARETEVGTAGMQPLPRDNLAGSSRRWPERGGACLCALQNTHRIGRPLCLENPRPKGGMLIHRTTPHCLHSPPSSIRGVAPPGPPKWLPPPPPLTLL